MNRAKSQFAVNLESARQLGVIYEAFEQDLTEAVPLDELLRAQIVLVVSALDCYVHDIARIRMSSILSSMTSYPNAFLSLGVSMDFVIKLLQVSSAADTRMLFEQEVRRLHGFKTFQKARAISEVMSLIGVQSLWDKVASELGRSSSDVRTELDLIVDRRNRIAHEGDVDPSAGWALKYPIDLASTRAATDFVESVVEAMHNTIIAESTP